MFLKPYFHGTASKQGAVLARDRLAVHAGRDERKFVCRLLDSETIRVGPRIPKLFEAWHVLLCCAVSITTYFAPERGLAKSTSAFIGKPLHGMAIDQASTQESIEPFFQRHMSDEGVEVDCHLLFDHTVKSNRPGAYL